MKSGSEFLRRSLVRGVLILSIVVPLSSGGSEDDPTPSRPPVADEVLDELVTIHLARSDSLAGTEIVVTETGRNIKLHGFVQTEAQRQRAEQIARRTRGVREVTNEIIVDPERAADSESVTDEALARDVAVKLATDTFPSATARENWLYGWEVEAHNWDFDVEADGGRITLQGSVGEFEDISRAVRAARAVPGVRSVDSNLTVENYLPIPGPLGFPIRY